MSLEYSDEANATRYLLLKETNEVNFFVEDKDKEYEYEAIFTRLFGKKYKINTIFGVGGKPQLIDRYLEFGEKDLDSNAMNVYIADGDFDILLTPDTMIDNPHFIYLKAYDIETYYIDEEAIIEYARGLFKKKKQEVKDIIKFDEWKDRIIVEGTRIFFTHCFVQKFCSGLANIGKGPAFFIDEKTGFEREGSYQRYVDEILDGNSIDVGSIEREIQNLKLKYKEIYGDNYLYLICGKFLLHSLYKYILSLCGKKRIDHEILKWYLINHFNVDSLEYIKDRVISLE